MATVYCAFRDDDAFQKTVALKLVRGGTASEYVEWLREASGPPDRARGAVLRTPLDPPTGRLILER